MSLKASGAFCQRYATEMQYRRKDGNGLRSVLWMRNLSHTKSLWCCIVLRRLVAMNAITTVIAWRL